ncbi:MAG: hypothetical protein H0U65_05835 [Rubrobacter sp.]|nr:hypothetical protein [Rubrobacter sp.]
MRDSTTRYEVVHISFIRPHVAIVNVRQRPVYVISKDEDSWKITAAQTTPYRSAVTEYPLPLVTAGRTLLGKIFPSRFLSPTTHWNT